MRSGRPAIAATVLIGCGVTLAAQTAVSAAVPSAPAGGTGAARSLCAPPADTVGPIITQVTFGRASINLQSRSWVQTIRARATDTSGDGDPSGVARVTADIHGPRFFAGVKLKLVSGTAASGTWAGRFVVSKYSQLGTYSIDFLSTTDAAGNVQYYPGYGKIAQGPNALSLHPDDNPTFTVTGTPATRPPRKPAGTLSAFSISRSRVNTTSTARPVRFVARFKGASPARVFVQLSSARHSARARYLYLHTVLHKHHGKWSGSVRVPRWVGDQALQAELAADFGAHFRPSLRSYNALQLHQLHFPNSVTVVSGVDRTKPNLRSLSFSPSEINSTSGPEQVTVTAKANDTLSGVRFIIVDGFIRHGINGVPDGSYPHAAAGVGYLSSENFHVRLKKSSSGNWVGTTTIRRCVPSGTYKLDVSLRDAADNFRSYSTKRLAAAHITSTIEVTSKHGDTVAPYVYSAATYGAESALFVNFSEGVANVSTSTLTVYPLSPKASRFTKPATVTAIVCSNGRVTIDCSGSGDLVTSAKLTVPAMRPGKKYEVYANLSQVVAQLTDGNRNPMDWNNAATRVIDA